MPNKALEPTHEVELIQGHGIKVTQLKDIVASLAKDRGLVNSAAGADFIDLIHMGAYAQQSAPADRLASRFATARRPLSLGVRP